MSAAAARRLLTLTALSAVLLFLPGAAHAAVQAEIRSVTQTAAGLEVLVAGTDLSTEELHVTLNGRPVAVDAALAQRRAARTVVMLVVDTSGSMAGAAMDQAKQAGHVFLQALPAEVEVGLVSFSDRPVLLTAPTRDRGAVGDALARLVARGETSLYDAVAAAVDALPAADARRIVVLSDGGDTRSLTALPEVVRRVLDAEVTVDAVALTTRESAAGGLQELTAVQRGNLLPVEEAAGLTTAFRELAGSFDQVLVTVPVPEALAGEHAELVVSITSQGSAVRLARAVQLRSAQAVAVPAPAPAPTSPAAATSPGLLAAGLLALGLGLFLLTRSGADLLVGGGRDRRRMAALLGSYGTHMPHDEQRRGSSASRFGDTAAAQSALEWAGRLAQKRGLEERLGLKLDRAGLRFTPGEWLVLQAGLGLLSLLTALLLTRDLLLSLVLATAATVPASVVMRVKGSRRRAAFQEQLPDSLRLVSSSLSSGYSLPQGLDALVRDGTQPMAGEIGRALAETRLGVDVEDTLEQLADRMDSVDMKWTVMAVRVQREVGGNLAEVLETVAATIRERGYLRRQVRSLSAEGRLSAYILLAMPVLIALYLYAVRREYLSAMWTTLPGVVMSFFATVAMLLGWLWMRKLVKVEV